MTSSDDTYLERFLEEGFVRLPQLYTSREVAELRAAFEGLHEVAEEVLEAHLACHEPPAPGQTASMSDHDARFTFERSLDGNSYYIRHIAQCGNIAPTLDVMGRDERLLRIASKLLDSEVMIQLINQAHFKQPGSSVAFDWHQDSSHRGMGNGLFEDLNGRGSYVQIAIALDDVTPENGPLQFIPGSNKLGHLGLTKENHDLLLSEKLDLKSAVAPMLEAGDAVAFGPYTVHGSEANRSYHWRRVFINGFAYPGADKKEHALPGVGRTLTLRNASHR